MSTTRPARTRAREDQPGAPRGDAGGERSGGRDTEEAAGVDELVGGRVEPGTAVGEVEQPAPADRDHQPADPEVASATAASASASSSSGGARAPARCPSRDERDGHDEPAPADDHADAGVEAATDRARRRRRTRPCPATIPSAMHSRPGDVARVAAERRTASAEVSRSTNVGGGRRLLPGRRALRAPAPGPLGRSHSGHNRTSDPISHKGNTTSRRLCSTSVGIRRIRRTDVGGYLRRLAGGAEGGAPGVDDGAPELGAAAQAGLAGAAVGAELELVAAGLAVGGAVVAQRGAAVGDALLEDDAQLGEQPVGLLAGDRAAARVDAGAPQRLVGVDVADARDRPLRQQLGLDAGPAAPRRPPKPAVVERLVPRLGPWAASVGSEAYSPAGTTPMRPNRRTSRSSSTRPSSSAHHARTYGSSSPGRSRSTPVIPRWTTSSRSSSSASSRYLPRRPTASMRAPAANGADANFGDGCPHASVIGAPATSGSSCRRTVSTSGSSGIARQHAVSGRLLELVGQQVASGRPSCQVPSAAALVTGA